MGIVKKQTKSKQIINKSEFIKLVEQYIRFENTELLVEVQHYLSVEENANDFVSNADNYAFHIIVDKLKLTKLKNNRQKRNNDVLGDFRSYNIDYVKEVFCDKYFNNNSNNVNLTLSSILERVKFSRTYKEVCLPYQKPLKMLKRYLETGKFALITQLSKFVEDFNLKNVIETLINEANNEFYLELENGLTQVLLKDIEPQILLTNNGTKVKFYTISKQTNNQKNFNILFKTIDYQDTFYTTKAMQFYLDKEKSIPYSSFSLIGQSNKLNGLGIYRRIILGFTNLGKSKIISCNTHDGYVNQLLIKKNKFVRKQEFLPIEIFLKQTGVYNEIVFTNSHTMKPSFIISLSNEPNENLIEIASNFNLPIVYIDNNTYSYRKLNDDNMKGYYRYQAF